VNFFKIFKYGAMAVQIITEVSEALSDGRLTTQEGLDIIHSVLKMADIDGLNVDLIQIAERPDGGFNIEFPHEAIKDWSLNFDFDF
jgi:hypothetical protein